MRSANDAPMERHERYHWPTGTPVSTRSRPATIEASGRQTRWPVASVSSTPSMTRSTTLRTDSVPIVTNRQTLMQKTAVKTPVSAPPCRRLAALFVLFLTTVLASAQCDPQWVPGDGIAGMNNRVSALLSWDPDGPGGAPAKLVAGGTFTLAGPTTANLVAVREEATGVWSPLGTGLLPGPSLGTRVAALASLPNGDLIVGGNFAMAGGGTVNNIARWNGSSWSALGSGMNGDVFALAALPNGDLVAGGVFTTAGGGPANFIARWNGFTWSPLGTGTNAVVQALAVLPNGDLIAGGTFTMAGGAAANGIARWNGSTWSALGTGVTGGTPQSNPAVRALTVLPNGDLVAGGHFTSAGSAIVNHIARWDGSTWSPLGTGMSGGLLPFALAVEALAVLPGGDLIATGLFPTAGGVTVNHIARWNGATWSPLGTGMAVNALQLYSVFALARLPNGDLVAGGELNTAGGLARYIARWNGSAWSAIGTGMDGPPWVLALAPNGDVIAGGQFAAAGSVLAANIARWNGSTWSALGTGLRGPCASLATLPNGHLIAGGSFVEAGGSPASFLARWDGNAWSAFGGGMNSSVFALVALPSGDLIAGGSFTVAGGTPANRVARWNGSSWSALGTGRPGSVGALAVLPNGDVIAGSSALPAGSSAADYIARWDGSIWSPLGAGMNNGVSTITVLPDGDLVVGGRFTTAGGVPANRIARWNGSTWSPLGTGLNDSCSDVLVLPDGDLIAVGSFTTAGGVPANRIARWNGSTWSPLGTGINASLPLGGVAAVVSLPGGDIAVGGDFLTAGGLVAAFFARLVAPCPASATIGAAGCTSSGGANLLSAINLPWTGSTFVAEGTGLPPFSVIGVVTGFATITLPLSSVLVQGQPGCSLDVSPDVVDIALPTAGSARIHTTLPDSPALVGAVFRQQMIPFELDATLQFTAITATNSLSMTIGSL
jgi:trimeric autotransporter adhesin